jgi:hypothetical protein
MPVDEKQLHAVNLMVGRDSVEPRSFQSLLLLLVIMLMIL